jgi:hypothetical protein
LVFVAATACANERGGAAPKPLYRTDEVNCAPQIGHNRWPEFSIRAIRVS